MNGDDVSLNVSVEHLLRSLLGASPSNSQTTYRSKDIATGTHGDVNATISQLYSLNSLCSDGDFKIVIALSSRKDSI